MKPFAVYGVDTTKALAEFDTINEAIEFARKGLRNNGHSRTIKSRKYKSIVMQYRKVNGKIVAQRIEYTV